MSPRREWLERLCIGLESAGYDILTHDATYPGRLEVLGLAERTQRFTVYLRQLDAGWGLRRKRWGIWLPPEWPGRAPRYGEDLVLGYEPSLDVFAGWSGVRPRRLLPRRLEIDHESLLEAAGAGLSDYKGGAMAFRAESAWVHLATREERLPSLMRNYGRSRYRTADLGREKWRQDTDAAAAPMAEPPPPPAASPPPERPAREVETGFSPAESPGEPLSSQTPLQPEAEYLFWFGIGADTGASIETTPTPTPADLPDHAQLTVQLFPFDEEIELIGPTRGEVELMPDGRARVSRDAAVAPSWVESQDGLLFFRVRAGERTGVQRLRCSLYHGSTLLQSRLVSCQVGGEADPERPALIADLDYALATSLDLDSLEQVPAHELSLMINGSDGPVAAASHQFSFFSDGEEPLVANASLGAHEIARAIEATRGALRLASWDTEAEWVDGQNSYRYECNPGKQGDFEQDLITMALRGHRLYVSITRELSEGGATRAALREAMRKPGRIQIASAASGLYVPAALFYDQPLESAPSAESKSRFRLCEEFLAALDGAAPLEEARCLRESCPNHDERHVVCPSGFWGYRHEIGWPVGGEAPLTRVDLDGEPRLAIGVSTDSRLEHREEHIEQVLAMGAGAVAESREAFRDLVKSASPHLVYLYCHGGVTAAEKVPFLVLGPPESDGLDSAYLVDEGIAWGDPPPRPLVFINGCHTTALGPDQLGDLVGGFVKDANAIGIVGTEVTIFEPLARAFGEDMLASFLDGTMTIGAAIRRARFDLLRARNPLGLVYVPFVAADTRLVRPSRRSSDRQSG